MSADSCVFGRLSAELVADTTVTASAHRVKRLYLGSCYPHATKVLFGRIFGVANVRRV